MAIITGVGGGVTFTGADDDVRAWTIDAEVQVSETTTFDDTTAATFVSNGITYWSGSYERLINDDVAAWSETAGTAGAATFTLNSGRTLSGNIIVTGVGTPVSKTGGVVVQTITFRGNGALTQANPS